jgi:hypothetical protein
MRTHVSLGKDAPYTRPIERFGDVVAHPKFGGLPPGGFDFGSGTGEHNQRPTSRAMAKAAPAREPTIAVCKALRSGAFLQRAFLVNDAFMQRERFLDPADNGNGGSGS